MTDESAEATQAEAEAKPQAGTPEAQAAAGTEEETQPESISLDEAKKLRSEAAGLRKRLKAFEDAEKTRLDSEKTEAEKSASRITELEGQLTTERNARQALAVDASATAAARKLGFRSPDLAGRLLRAADIEFDDSGAPTNVERLLGDVAKEFPDLVNGTTDYGGGPRGSTPSGTGDMNRWIREHAGRR